ncbi:MAG: hypothetical protein EOP51_14660 [Sphingobacteriales bacterium]|nr:MAG: hypothetical protein EOP51_14660 [Sphingobacteriales bacterium]
MTIEQLNELYFQKFGKNIPLWREGYTFKRWDLDIEYHISLLKLRLEIWKMAIARGESEVTSENAAALDIYKDMIRVLEGVSDRIIIGYFVQDKKEIMLLFVDEEAEKLVFSYYPAVIEQ